jgi:hypothetical protein
LHVPSASLNGMTPYGNVSILEGNRQCLAILKRFLEEMLLHVGLQSLQQEREIVL